MSVENSTSPCHRLVSYASVEDDHVSITTDQSADTTGNGKLPSAVVRVMSVILKYQHYNIIELK